MCCQRRKDYGSEMKTLLLILCFLNPSRIVHFDSEVTFKRDMQGQWEGGDNANDIVYMTENPEVWLIYRTKQSKRLAGYCKFKQPTVKGPVKVIAIFPQPGFKMKQNLFTYQIKKNSKGTHWDVWDVNGVPNMRGE